MTIEINGSGTITGVSVGGLPDGIVDTDMLAADAVTAAKLKSDAIASGDLPAGSILQAISRSTTSTTTCGNQNVWTATDCYHSITTSSSSSKVIICVTSVINSYAANQWIDVDIYRGTTRLGDGSSTHGMTGNYADNDNHVPLGMTFLDSPGAAGTYTYKVYVKNRNGNGVNRFNADGQMTTMVLMEVAG